MPVEIGYRVDHFVTISPYCRDRTSVQCWLYKIEREVVMSGAEVFGTILVVFGILFGFAMLALLAISVVWVYRDAEQREGTGCLWSLLVFISWPIGLLLYTLLRRKAIDAGR